MELLSDDRIQQLIKEAINKVIVEQGEPMAQVGVKPKTTRVIFDKDTDAQFEVIFSERGFSINGTRLSFESINDALAKEYNITLDSGKGVHLTQVRMQKIMKYQDLY
jgi:hypothetical protein